jgi:hypothetical protein
MSFLSDLSLTTQRRCICAVDEGRNCIERVLFGALHCVLTRDEQMRFDGVEIDLLYAQLATNVVPAQIDLQDDALVVQVAEWCCAVSCIHFGTDG